MGRKTPEDPYRGKDIWSSTFIWNSDLVGPLTAAKAIGFARIIDVKLTENGFNKADFELEFHFPPLMHEGSNARYLLDMYYGQDRILASYIPENSTTTRHHHRYPMVEDYIVIGGVLYINRENIGTKSSILPGHMHQASTGKDVGALTIIRLRNALQIPEAEQHIHEEDIFSKPM